MDDLKNLNEKLSSLNNRVQQLSGAYNNMQETYNLNVGKVEQLTLDIELHSKAVELLSKVQAVTRDKIKNEFEQLVSFCLQFIFEEPYSFKLIFDKRGNLQELNFVIEKPGYDESHDLLDTSGGGVLNIVSFALRIILMEVSMPKNNGMIICDEPFSNLSENYHEKAALLLDELSRKLNRQFIIVSHESLLKEHPAFNKIEIK